MLNTPSNPGKYASLIYVVILYSLNDVRFNLNKKSGHFETHNLNETLGKMIANQYLSFFSHYKTAM